MTESGIRWPNEANCSVMLTVNLDAESFWMGLAADSMKRPKTLSMGEFGMKRGFVRVLDALDEYKLKATFFVPGQVVGKYPEHIREVAARGHEIGLHGYAHEDFGKITKQEMADAIHKGQDVLQQVCGVTAKGFRVPEGEMTREIYDVLADAGIEYSSSMFGDDRPYFVSLPSGSRILEIPAPWEINDFPYFAFNYTPAFPAGQGRIANYSHVLSTFKEEYRAYYRFGLCYVPQFDPQTIGTPGRIGLLEELLAYIKRQSGVWFCTGQELHAFWANLS